MMIFDEIPSASPVGSNGGFCLMELMKMASIAALAIFGITKMVRRG
jgi:hypothetical protein